MTDLDLDAIKARADAANGRFDVGRASARLYMDSAADVPALLARIAELEAEIRSYADLLVRRSGDAVKESTDD